ncbi:hypothetical protein G7046_g9664 [Stylonectria norvegica]|nr:hypothetical protein G7046_g9664 [Stylonectria norvegica]
MPRLPSRRLWHHSSKALNAMASSTPTNPPTAPPAEAAVPAAASAVAKLIGRSTIPDEAASNPHHILKGGAVVGFKNPYPSWSNPPSLGSILRTVVWPTLTGQLKQPDTSPPTVKVVKPTFLPGRFSSDKIRATWLGHACYYVEYPSGLRVLFDPVFEDRCSPFTFMGPKRFTEKPCDIKDIPIVDAVVISHSHYDHLSHGSILEVQKHNPEAQFFVGLGLEKWFRSSGIKHVTELDWWEEADLSVKVKDKDGEKDRDITARVSCLPAQHTSARTAFDKDTTLWCSWGVNSEAKNVWFGGDTGYRAVPALPAGTDDYGPKYDKLPRCPQFKQIGELRGPYDLGLHPHRRLRAARGLLRHARQPFRLGRDLHRHALQAGHGYPLGHLGTHYGGGARATKDAQGGAAAEGRPGGGRV